MVNFTLTQKDSEWVNEKWQQLCKKTEKSAVRARNKIPYTADSNGIYDNRYETEPDWWTNGFWPAYMWLMYVGTNNEEYKITAEKAEEMLDKAFEKPELLHHDVGFMWNISAGVNYRLTKNEKSKQRFILSAELLAARFNIEGNFIKAWNGKDVNGWTIIDSMMNIPLLYRVSELEGDPRLKYIALRHADKIIQDHVRPDGSVAHIVSHDVTNGDVIETFGGQGYGVGSSWSRGQSWAIYGFVLSYIHTGEIRYLDTAKSAAHYFIANVCDDYLPKCDFRSTSEPVIYDTTAGACAACGLIEIANCVPENEKKMYLNAALKILRALDEKFCDFSEDTDALLLCGTEAYDRGIHMPIIYGDYFYAEALYKLKGFDMLFW